MERFKRGVVCPLIMFISSMLPAVEMGAAPGAGSANVKPAESELMAELQKDAEQGNVRAQYVLGCCYNGDRGFPRDSVRATKWWGMAAASGFADAEFCLGLSCFMGEGIAKDAAVAVKWWKKAADQDNPDAEYFLGLSYRTGLGVPRSIPLAIFWLQKSASQGVRAAKDQLKEITSSPG